MRIIGCNSAVIYKLIFRKLFLLTTDGESCPDGSIIPSEINNVYPSICWIFGAETGVKWRSSPRMGQVKNRQLIII